MSAPGIVRSIHLPDFVAEATLDTQVELRLQGSADANTTAPMLELVTALHEAAAARHITEVIVDLRALEFMSAGSFNTLVTWLSLVQDLPVEGRYRIRIRSSANVMWQRRSLRTLSCFATDIISIET